MCLQRRRWLVQARWVCERRWMKVWFLRLHAIWLRNWDLRWRTANTHASVSWRHHAWRVQGWLLHDLRANWLSHVDSWKRLLGMRGVLRWLISSQCLFTRITRRLTELYWRYFREQTRSVHYRGRRLMRQGNLWRGLIGVVVGFQALIWFHFML